MRSKVLESPGILKHVGLFIKIMRRYKFQKSFKFEPVLSELKSPSDIKFS